MKLWKKALLVPPLLLALLLLQDDNDSKLALVTALSRHPPSLRVYRALLELSLLLFCGSLSLFVWKRAAGSRVVGILMFQPPQDISPIRGMYQALPTNIVEHHDTAATLPQDDDILTEEEAQDACYASDSDFDEEPPSSSLPTSHCDEPPTATSVANAALDLLLLVLISLFLFTISSAEGGKYIDGMEEGMFQWLARIAAPVFPLGLFVLAAIKSFFPFSKQRKDFWTVLSFTLSAPMVEVTFRDGFVGDVFTSTVRPLQDLAFTVFYIVSGLRGWWTQAYDLDNAQLPLETSWLLHTCVLPACMVSPLWWRFLQNLRQTYDNKQRWPYLGNAFKYFIAAQVSMMGLFDPSKKSSVLWILCFVFATLYQIFWDVFMDWELLEFSSNTTWRPRLRSLRLYPSRKMYWTILVVNFVLRFGWTLTFLPRWYLNSAGILERSFHGHFARVIGPMLASAEIVRRTMWGFLRLELEALKTCRDDPTLDKQLQRCSSSPTAESNEDGIEMEDMSSTNEPRILKALDQASIERKSDMSEKSDLQILLELCLYATAFAAFGMVAAAHRETM